LIGSYSPTSSGARIGYAYDTLNRLKSVIETNLSSGIRTTSYGYDLNGNLTTNSSGNGASHRYTYTEQDRLTNLVVMKGATNIATYYYQLGKAGSRTNVLEKSSRNAAYVYDKLYRLTSQAVTADPHSINGTATYQYDLVGNRTNLSSTLGGVTTLAQQFDIRDWPTNASATLLLPSVKLTLIMN
jgi:YD repeat-containing protein